MNETAETHARRVTAINTAALSAGWTFVSESRYAKGGHTYDLSAADLTQLERIEREGLFRVS